MIIGGSGGLGIELCRTFLRHGNRLAIHYHKNKKAPESLLNELGYSMNSDEAFACHADIREEHSVEEMFRTVKGKWSHLDILINSGGTTADALFSKMTGDQWNETLQINLTGLFICMKHAAKWMIPKRQGHIINIASRSGITGRAGQANYAASKAGVISLTKSASLEWGKHQIQVNAILPGFLLTGMGSKVNPQHRKSIELENALQRSSTVEEVSEFIFNLTRMKNVSGQLFNLDSRII